MMFGILALGFCALAYFEAAFSQAYETRELERSLSLPPSPHPAGDAGVSRLKIPRLGIGVIVNEGVGARILRIGAGHVPGTAFAGDRGNVVIAAHRDTFFRELRKIHPDDTILLETLHGTYEYSVEWTRVVEPSDREVMEASSESLLTLVTCYPFYYVGPAPERFIVRARRIHRQ
ncbi:MAG TPA: class D sortase [Bryobacteraceae bacterium]|nr:class D sortase [Bryobacteraceae bacterium]